MLLPLTFMFLQSCLPDFDQVRMLGVSLGEWARPVSGQHV